MALHVFTYDYKCATDLGPINFYGSFSPPLSLITQSSILLPDINMLGHAFLGGSNTSELWSGGKSVVSIIIHFSLRRRFVSLCLTCCDVTQDQGFHSAAYTCWMFVRALLYVIVWAVLYSVIDETINIYKLKLNWMAKILITFYNECYSMRKS